MAKTTELAKMKMAQRKCAPCEGGTKSLTRDQAQKLLKEVPAWRISPDGKSIRIEYTLKNFMSGVKLINEIARVAEGDNHHPDLHLVSYRKLQVVLATHAVGGLSENDFILASKIDELPKETKAS